MELINSKSSMIFEKELISNQNLLQNVHKIYQTLLELDLLENKKIAIFLDRDHSVIYSIAAILATSSMYIPIDTKLPAERVKLILDNSQADIILTNEKYKEMFPGKCVLCMEPILEKPKEEHWREFPNVMGKGAAYILFTSGTTGIPKGVMVSKRSLENFILGTKQEIDFSKCSSIVCLTTVSFDIFFLESIFSLHIGLRVLMTNYSEQQNPRFLKRLLQEYQVDTLQMTPAKLRQLYTVDKKLSCLSFMKLMIIGGEAFPEHMLDILREHTNAKIYNAYGPTEATIWISYSCLNGKSEVDIGKPMQNNSFYLMDEAGELVSENQIGELCISGLNLADCYVNDDYLTKEKFKDVWISEGRKDRLYKTGDLCSIGPDGNARCLGRKDHQVKINGFRIELEEIETCISKCAGIENAIVYCEETDSLKTKSLVCIYCGEMKTGNELKEWTSHYLPDYMVPKKFQWIPQFDYTIGGKADRQAIIEKAKSREA